MGMSFRVTVYDLTELRKELEKAYKPKKGQLKPAELLDKAKEHLGVVVDDKLIIQQVEYWEEYDPWHAKFWLFDSYYGDDSKSYDAWKNAEVADKYHGANANDIAEEIGIELPESDEDYE